MNPNNFIDFHRALTKKKKTKRKKEREKMNDLNTRHLRMKTSMSLFLQVIGNWVRKRKQEKEEKEKKKTRSYFACDSAKCAFTREQFDQMEKKCSHTIERTDKAREYIF